MTPTREFITFENAVGRLLEHPEGYVAFECHAGPRKLSDLQGLLVHVGLSLQQHSWHKVLWNQCVMAPFTKVENTWIIDYWVYFATRYPKGLQVAIVQARDVYTRLAVNQLLQQAQVAPFAYRVFESETLAAAWLRALGEPQL
jgi:hypothetical protein